MARKNKSKLNKKERALVKVMTGRGAYKEKSSQKEVTRLGKALRMLGGLGGATIGGWAGHPLAGGTLGTSLGAAISKWLGSGAYEVRVNSILKPDSQIPSMHKEGQSVIVRHKEFICDVTGKQAFTIGKTMYLNPGLYQSFPWLSTIARQFQEYTWRGMVFHYVSTSGSLSTTSALGTVMLHTDYRVTAPSPVNKSELLNEYFASDNKPAECFVHPIECDPKENPYNVQYIRSGDVPAGEDAKSYDLGKTHLAVANNAADDIGLGELWVTYEVELRKPQISSYGGDMAAHYQGITSINTTTPFGTNITKVFDDIGVTVSTTGKTITFPKGTIGKFMILHDVIDSATNTLTTVYSTATYTNCTAISTWSSSGTVRNHNINAGAGGGGVSTALTISDTSVSAVYTLTYATMTNANYCDLYIIRLSPTFL